MKKKIYWIWFFLGGAALFFWMYFPSLSHYRDLRVEQEEMEREIQDLEEKIKGLSDERELLKNDPGYLEKVIRDELGLVKPGEIVYKFVPEETSLVKEESKTEKVS